MLQMQLALSSRSGIEEDGKGGAGDNIGMASKQPREGGMNLRQQAVRPHLPDSTASHHGQQLVPCLPPGVQYGTVGLLRHIDRKSGVEGKSVFVRVELGGGRSLK